MSGLLPRGGSLLSVVPDLLLVRGSAGRLVVVAVTDPAREVLLRRCFAPGLRAGVCATGSPGDLPLRSLTAVTAGYP